MSREENGISPAFGFLPGTLQEIAELIGIEGALLLAEKRGGGRLSIPSRITADSPLARLVGMEAAQKLSDHFAAGFTSCEIEIPLGPTGARAGFAARMSRAIVGMMERGVPHEQIARQLRISSRTVRRHRARRDNGPRDKRQGSLFE